MPVTYKGTVPDPFRGGREIVLTGSVENGTFVGEPDTLITKCPSKFTTRANALASAAPCWRWPSSPPSSPPSLALARPRGDERRVVLSRRAVYAFCALVTACVVIIEIAFASDDFSFSIVAEHSSIETPIFYKLAAMWSSQEGSLLLWAWVLSIASSAALYVTRNKLRELVPYATAVMMGDRRLLHRADAVRARRQPLRRRSARRRPTGSASTRCCSTRA